MSETTLTVEPGTHEVVVSHVFAAPRELVFDTVNDPQLLTRWWGPDGYESDVEVMDVRPGGRWRVVQRNPEGEAFGFRGVYHSVRRPERVVSTFEFDGTPDHVLLQVMTFDDVEGGTLLTIRSVFESVADRDGMVAAGMERGVRDGNRRLERLLAERLSAATV